MKKQTRVKLKLKYIGLSKCIGESAVKVRLVHCGGAGG